MPFLKQLLGKPLAIEDLRMVDPVLYKNRIELILKSSPEELECLDLTFVEEETTLLSRETKEVDLMMIGGSRAVTTENGSGRAVTTENRADYVDRLCHHLLTSKIFDQTKAMLRGLHQMIPKYVMEAMSICLTAEELDEIIGGKMTLDIDDWEQHTIFEDGEDEYNAESPQVVWFWEVLRAWDSVQHSKLFQFVSGSASVGPSGFEHLQGYSGEEKKFTIRKGKTPSGGGAWELPKAQTCFNVLIIPPYETKEALGEKLQLAMMAGCSAFDEGAVAE